VRERASLPAGAEGDRSPGGARQKEPAAAFDHVAQRRRGVVFGGGEEHRLRVSVDVTRV
jgi:hypothetical protein